MKQDVHEAETNFLKKKAKENENNKNFNCQES